MKKRYLKHAPKTVALLGMGPSCEDIFSETLTQEVTPGHHDEVWAINMAAIPFHADVVFVMDDLRQQENHRAGWLALIKRRGTPVITSKRTPGVIPNSYDYPLDEVARISTPHFGKPYLSNAVAMAIGYAMHKGVKTLKIYGCDFTYPNRNFAEEGRANVEAWITLAAVSGMGVQLSPNTSLFDMIGDKGIYGYAEQPAIDLGGGKMFQYKPPAPQGERRPEDSSPQEVKNALQRAVPGDGSRTADSGGPGPAADDAPAPDAPAAVGGPGEGLRDPTVEPGRDEGKDSANPG